VRKTKVEKKSINRRLTRTVFFVTVSTLVIACLVFITVDWVAARRSISRNTETLAQLIGANCTTALGFYDTVTATEILDSLRAAPVVDVAVVYDDRGRTFASYTSAELGTDPSLPETPTLGANFGLKSFELTREILLEGEFVGTIYIRANTNELGRRVQGYALVIGLLLAVVAAVTWFIASRLRDQITEPLTALANAAASISGGNLASEVPIDSDDEIGTLASAFNAMVASLREIVGQVGHNIREVSEVSDELQRHSAKMSADAQRQSVAIDETTESIEQLSGSSVEVNAKVAQVSDSARETSSSILEMDASIISVAQHMDHLAESIEATSEGVMQVASGTDQVVSGVSTLKGATEESMEQLQQLRLSVQHVRENAGESHSLCDEASREATKGLEAVNETISVMSEISNSFNELEKNVSRLANNSNSIGEILEVIREVAEQTGMLSLNAAIIAAQAGEHGKAFSVVADEVNSLAGRTHRSTQEIAKLVQAVQNDTAAAVSAAEVGAAVVEKGVQRSNLAGKVLGEISAKSTTSTEKVHQIYEASSQQSRELERVERAMTEVRDIVEQINRSTLDQQAATTEIANAVENIRSLGKGVKSSTDEQRRGSRLMTDSVTHVAAMLDQISEATRAQAKSSETIQHALQVFRDVTSQTLRRSGQLDTMVETLSVRSDRLDDVVVRFKTT
jgi:methyl-accepting chemotaxis protein